MKRFGIGLLYAIGGYVLVAFASYLLVLQFSSNRHDLGLEAGMTSVFFFGPIGAVIGFVLGVFKGRQPAPADAVDR